MKICGYDWPTLEDGRPRERWWEPGSQRSLSPQLKLPEAIKYLCSLLGALTGRRRYQAWGGGSGSNFSPVCFLRANRDPALDAGKSE